MRKIRRAALAVACILFACGVLLSFGGCAEHGASTDSPTASPIIIGISVPRSEEAPVTNALLSIQNNLKPEEEIILKDAEGSNDKQEADIIELADQEIDVLLVIPNRYSGLQNAFAYCNSKSIPIIVFQTTTKYRDQVSAQIYFDYWRAGAETAKAVASRLAADGSLDEAEIEIGMINNNTRSHNVHNSNAFIEGLSSYKNIRILPPEYVVAGTIDDGIYCLYSYMDEYPSIKVLWSINDRCSIGAIYANLQGDTDEDLIFVSTGGTQDALKLVKAGRLLSTVWMDQQELGKRVVETVHRLLDKEAFEFEQVIEPVLVTKKNVDQFLKQEIT